MRTIARLLALLFAANLAAQDVDYREDFQSYKTPENPAGWVDTSVGTPKPQASGLFKTWDDPLAANNVVYGTKQSSGKPEGNNPRIGTFSTLTTKTFSASGRFEYSGRMLRTNADSRIGLTFLSAYPEVDKYYLIGLWSQSATSRLTMQLFGGTFTGKTDSDLVIDPNRWYRFLIQVDDVAGATNIRARFWLDGTSEPTTFAIEASDATPLRLKQGRIGMWAAVKGDAYIDDLSARSPVDHAPPVITLLIDGAPFATGAIFSKDVTLSARIEDVSSVTSKATLNGSEVTLPRPIADERAHAISVTATDQVGLSSSASSNFIVDKTAPVVTILANGRELGGGESFQTDVTLTWSATDLTLDRVEATLDGAPVSSGALVTAEAVHDLIVKAYDKAGHVTTETRRFVLDKTAPEVRLLANGETFKPSSTANAPITFTVEARDTTPTTPVATIDDQPYTLGTPYSTEGPHTIKVVVTNAAGLSTTVGPSPFTIDLTKPAVTLTESGEPFRDGMKFARDVNPVVAATDNLTANPERALTLNGAAYPLDTPISEEKAEHVISAAATDAGGNIASVGPFRFVLDKTKPLVVLTDQESGQPFANDAVFARAVRVKVTVTDLTGTTIAATLNGAAFDLTNPITGEGTHTVSVVATDAVGNRNDPVTATFTIDTTPPRLTFTSHQDGAVIITPNVVIAGNSDDAVSVIAGNEPATIDAEAKTFRSGTIALLEGTNTIAVSGTDRAGNRGTAQLRLELDTRAPQLVVTAPAVDACIDAASVTVTGTVSDPRIAGVKVNNVAATITNGAWTANVPVNEGAQLLTIVATDAAGHITTIARNVRIDRTAPQLEVRESGAPFTATLLNRAVSFLFRAVDADPTASITATLDGAPYAPGASVTAEGAHQLVVTAVDCANHRASRTFAFTIDRTPPQIRNLNPANGAAVGVMPNAISGATDADAATIELLGTALVAHPAPDATFVLQNVSFGEGTNRFVLRATDKAGNSAQSDYVVSVKTSAPDVVILESGSPLAPNTIFNRAVAPQVRSNDADATISAKLNNAPFTSGTQITADGDYRLIATATDSHGHTRTVETTFTIDRTPPVVRITFPQSGSVSADAIEVRGNAGNAVAADVNGIPVTLGADGAFVLPSLRIEPGTTRIVATGRDRAGNAGRDEVEVTRADVRPGIILTWPYDRALTNRATTDVLGRVLSPSPDGAVTIGTATIAVDPLGAFRMSGYPLVEGDNTITATTKSGAGTNSATVIVTADFTPPALAILESNQPLEDGARFAQQAVLSTSASDTRGGSVTVDVTLDGAKITLPQTVTSSGGHVIIAVARDQAGNETRVERAFFVGTTGGGAASCALSGFDPADNAVVLSSSVTLLGRLAGATGVKVNGIAATVADGSFRATVELPLEGANAVTVRCTDGAGAAFGDAVTLTLHRVTGDPSISISSPSEGFVTTGETVAVTGVIGGGVTTADVNGAPATIAGNAYTVPSVRLASGLNVLVAHGRNAAGRVATASRRVIALKTPPSISISTPLNNATTGATKIDLGGAYANLDPSTLAVTNLATGTTTQAQPARASDTTGSFTAIDVALVSGEQTLRVSGRDLANREATATVTVKVVAGGPSISIVSPANHTYYGPGTANTVTVSGTFAAAPGSTVEVNGVVAAINGASFTAAVPFAAIATTTVVARVTEPSGGSAIDSVVVTRLTAAPKVIESFPAPNAVEVDAGALLLVLFSAPMDRATLVDAFRLDDAGGARVSGTLYLDKDVLTFAPAALLARGARYTLRVTTAAKDLAGTSITNEWIAGFTVGTSAPSTPPSLTPVAGAFCGQTVAINGTAPAGARLQLESSAQTLTTTANAQGSFTFDFPLSGQSGFATVRVRIAGSDGSLSPAAELTFRVDCAGPQVLNAAYDRSANRVTIEFSEAIDVASVTAESIALSIGSRTANVSGNVVTLTPAEDLRARTFAVNVTTAVRDAIGNHLAAPYTRTFTAGAGEAPPSGNGSGFISGEVYDATTGRPLAGVSVEVFGSTIQTDASGRYAARVSEGAHTIRASQAGYTSAWRQIVIPAGTGIVPIDIRLTRLGTAQTHGGDTSITKRVELTGTTATVTAVGAQSLAGLLPLGWSPLASAVMSGGNGNATLTFHTGVVTTPVTAVRYDEARDEWSVLAAVVNVVDGKVALPVTSAGAYALVYPDRAPGLAAPPLPSAGAVLTGVSAPATLAPLAAKSFTLDPPVVLPNGRAAATLQIEGAGSAIFPSGTAVQAYIDEELRLADGSRLLDAPFATDLLLYRDPAGATGIADFHLAPSPRAAQVILDIGFDHIRVVPYPGRLDRGTLVGAEGGRIPADEKVAVEIPAAATSEPLRVTASSLSAQELAGITPIQGFKILGGFTLTLQRATQPPPTDLDNDGQPDEPKPQVELSKPARATLSTQQPALSTQLILVELLADGARLAAQMLPVDGSSVRFTTKSIDRAVLPLDGVVREGRYLLLGADAPIAFATGTLKLANTLLADARITAAGLGVAERTRISGIYNIPVPAKPAAPFTLTPRHASTGDGAPYTHAAAPDADAVVKVDLTLTAQPPRVTAVTVTANNASVPLSAGSLTSNVSLSTAIRASFAPSIDPASITDSSITVLDSITGIAVAGKSVADGSVAVNWSLTPGTRLQSGRRYTVLVSPRIRAGSGAELGTVTSYSFATVTIVTNAEVRAERISITIPNAQGVSRVTGEAGALPAGWQAVVVRRRRDFITRYQATAASDGSFAFLAGNGGDPADRITLSDLIDLHAVNNAGIVAAILPLTPFVTEDRRGFVASPDVAATVTTADGIKLELAAGTFDEPTVVSVTVSPKTALDDIPSLDHDLNFAASVKLDFQGRANKPIEIELPVPAGMDTTNREFILTMRGESVRGPRLMAVDTLRVVNGKFTTALPPANAAKGPTTHATLVEEERKERLLRVTRSGVYNAVNLRPPDGGAAGWVGISGVETNNDLFWSSIQSFYASHEYLTERGGHIVIPIIQGTPFTLVGVDAATGLEAFSKVYDPIPIGDPGVSTLPVPVENAGGPYPIFGTPFRVETLELNVSEVEIRSIRNFIVQLENERVTVKPSEEEPLSAKMRVELINITRDKYEDGYATEELEIEAQLGDRLIFLIDEEKIDPGTALSVVFNEPIYIEGEKDDEVDAFLREKLVLEQGILTEDSELGPTYSVVTDQARFSADSGGRRVSIAMPSSLKRDVFYRLTLKKEIADRGGQNGAEGMKLAGENDLHLTFRVRAPGGTVGEFNLIGGEMRDMALNGNVLLIAAGDAGVLAYDVSDPAGLTTDPTKTKPIAQAKPLTRSDVLTVATDHHGRVYATGLDAIAGYVRSYRLEDFIKAKVNNTGCCEIKGGGIINWRIGYSGTIGVPSNTVLSDRPESFPRKLQLLVQDDETSYANRDKFIEGTGAEPPPDGEEPYPGDVQKLSLDLELDSANPYLVQRITVENQTLDLRWSADATPAGAAHFDSILAGPNDRLRVIRNRTTYGIVSHLGHGIGMYDLNAVESNHLPSHPFGYRTMREQLVLTRGLVDDTCTTPYPPGAHAIPEIWLSSDAAVRPDPDSETNDILIYAPDPYRGLLDLRFRPPASSSRQQPRCEQRGPNGLVLRGTKPENDHKRIAALKAAFQERAGRPAYPQFLAVANYRWRIEAQDNKLGVRRTVQNEEAVRDYVLMAGGDLGLLVVEVGGKPAPYSLGPESYWPLEHYHLADIIWIPGGALAVRAIPRTNLAVVATRTGRVHLIDLSRIDERFTADDSLLDEDEMFPTALAALRGPAAYADGIGAEDPRIVWTSEPGLANGIIAPIVDPDTGMLYAGRVMEKVMKAVAALDPRIRMKVDLGDENGLSEVGGVVPHGIAPPQSIIDKIDELPECEDGGPTRCRDNASLGTFRLELMLPGAIVEKLAAAHHELRVAVESERVFNAPSEQTPPGFPRSHLRRARRDGSPERPNRAADHFRLRRLVPEDPDLAKTLRYQKGYNKFISPWIVALADPRASAKWLWPENTTKEQKEEAGCAYCERPKYLDNVGEAGGVYELWTNGRLIAVRPEIVNAQGANLFDNTEYEWLGEADRLVARFATIMADTVRPMDVRVAGQNPPIAGGAIQETVYLHSGELETSAVDLIAGGRAGLDVAFDRTYRSRTLGNTLLGQGWNSSNLQRLRAMPNGDVEYRDAAGEVWLFEVSDKPGIQYDSPPGLFLKLSHGERGWTVVDQQLRVTGFDEFGRLSYESDQFAKAPAIAAGTNDGNVIRYLYDSGGRLAQIVDPVERATQWTYWSDEEDDEEGAYPGLLKEIKDWRERTVSYEYDVRGRLTSVHLPEAAAGENVPDEFELTGDKRPVTKYTYDSAPPAYSDAPEPQQAYNDFLEYNNLLSIKEADQVALADGGKPRLTFKYGTEEGSRDRLIQQNWATSEVVTLEHVSATEVKTKDALEQEREYTLTELADHDKRVHVAEETLRAVHVVEVPDELPEKAEVTLEPAEEDLTWTYEYNHQGLRTRTESPDGLVVENTWGEPRRPNGLRRLASAVAGLLLDEVKMSLLAGPALGPIITAFRYATGSTSTATIAEVGRPAANNALEFRNAEQPSRDDRKVTVRDLQVTTQTEVNKAGQVIAVRKWQSPETAPVDADETPAVLDQETKTDYYDANATDVFVRSRVKTVYSADQAIRQELEYSAVGEGGEKILVRDPLRGTVFETWTDAYDRTTRTRVTGDDGKVLQDESFAYDAAGRLIYHSRLQEGVGTVVTRTTYDAIGRAVETSIDGAQVDGTLAKITQKTVYDGFTITEYDPIAGGAAVGRTITSLDRLGRPSMTERLGATSDERIKTYTSYDKAGALSYETDGVRHAMLTKRDVYGRVIAVIDRNGVRSLNTWSAWDQPVEMKTQTAGGTLLSLAKQRFTGAGRLRTTSEQLDTTSTKVRLTELRSEKGDKKQSARVGEAVNFEVLLPPGEIRLRQQHFDFAGRLDKDLAGSANGPAADLTDETTFSSTDYDYNGSVPTAVTVYEPQAGALATTVTMFDGLQRPIEVAASRGESQTFAYDEAGNVLRAKAQGMGESTAKYDSRGLTIEATHPGGGTIRRKYDARGNLTSYTDESGAETTYTYDGLGRLFRIGYPDGTQEETIYEPGTGVVTATCDRAGKCLAFAYRDAGGAIESVHQGRNTSGLMLKKYDYDAAGRLIRVRNKDAGIAYENFDLLGRPGTTKTFRYKDGSGLADSPTTLDVHTQSHKWSVYDERIAWRMPAAGSSVPESESDSPWLQVIEEKRDGGSNVILQQSSGKFLASSIGRAAGKISFRQRDTGGEYRLDTLYGYADGTPAPPSMDGLLPADQGSKSFFMRFARTTYGGMAVGGSANGRHTSDRIARAIDFSLAERVSEWQYDDRGRLERSRINIAGPEAARPPTADAVTSADFRSGRTIAPFLTPEQREDLGIVADVVEPATWTATENRAHQLQTRSTGNSYQFEGGRRVSDGNWTSSYDNFGRLVSIANVFRKIEYTWGPNDRIVGRAAYRNAGNGWVIEDQQSVLDKDGLPALTTFVWDPIEDRLVSIFEEGRSGGQTVVPAAGLLRQYLHGDQGYDDPVRVLVGDGRGGVRTYLPVFDEATTGSLQAVVDGNTGAVVERVLYADAYGDAPRYLNGAVVDGVTFEAKKDGEGKVEKVTIRIHLTEAIRAGSLEHGVRLTSTRRGVGGGTIESAAVPTLPDPNTIQWEIGRDYWNTLAEWGRADGLFEISITNDLEATRWGNADVTPVPFWAAELYPVSSTPATPLVIGQSFSQIDAYDGPQTLYAMSDLYLAASRESKIGLLTGFKAAPFVEPATGLVYFRARWYDAATGTWLTPDPMGYVDSSNAYAAFAHDPVNQEDPTGELIGFLFDGASAAWDTFQYATGGIDGNEYALRMSLTAASVVANVATGGFGGIAVRAAAMAGRAGQVARGVLRAATLVNRADDAYNGVQAAIGLNSAIESGDVLSGGLNAIPLLLKVLGLRSSKGGPVIPPSRQLNAASALVPPSRQLTSGVIPPSRQLNARPRGRLNPIPQLGPHRLPGRVRVRTPWQRVVYRRHDIDWDLVRPSHVSLPGLTNRQAAARGYAPGRINPATGRWDVVTLHHLLDNPRGALRETWSSSHTRFHQTMERHPNEFNEFHGLARPWREQRPEWVRAWDNEVHAYWRWISNRYHPQPTPRLTLPGDP